MIRHRRLYLDEFSPITYYHKIKSRFQGEPAFLFESGVNNDSGNFSYVVVGARESLRHRDGKSFYKNLDGATLEVDENPLAFLKKYYAKIDFAKYKAQSEEIGVGFVDGFIGYIGYDMVQTFEPVLKKSMTGLDDPLNTPDFQMIRPRLILAYAHKSATLTLVSSDPEIIAKFDDLESYLKGPALHIPLQKAEKLGEAKAAFDKEGFFDLVEKSKEMIRSGDVFQILMSNRILQPAKVDPFSYYRILRRKNPSPYQYLLDTGDFAIAGSSPEVMVRLTAGEILLRPIAGTRKRGKTVHKDKEMEEEMLADPKERAEHIMLVDLGRNDVGRVAKTGTVTVDELMRVERYSHVMHMVSDVTATLDEGKDMFDLFMATFTAGTMTGAPKIRAMELIAEFEGMKRGFYSGSIGYFGFNGDMDSAITIRTALIRDDFIAFHAGAGVVADSVPELEELEVRNKMAATIASYQDLLDL